MVSVVNGAYAHLLLNHFPVLGMLFSAAFLGMALKTRNVTTQQSALVLLVFTALMTIPAYFTGEYAEGVVENLPAFKGRMLEAHAEFAEKAVWLIWITGGLAAVGLCIAYLKKDMPAWLMPTLFVLSLGSLAAAGWTSKLGGPICHPELRRGFVVPTDDAEKNEAASHDAE